MKYIILCMFFLFCLFLISGCGATVCRDKNNSKHGIFFNYENLYGHKYVDIGHLPTFVENNEWVKKLIVKDSGFLLVSSQKKASCKNKEAIKEAIKTKQPLPACERIAMVAYPVRRYIEDQGYEEWGHLSEEEWSKVADLKHTFSKQADYHYENCSYHIFGRFYMFLAVLDFI